MVWDAGLHQISRILGRMWDGARQTGCWWDAGQHQAGGLQDSTGCKTALGDHDQKSPGTSLVTCQKVAAQETI